ncbi:MAG: serine--tRNA ligase [Deltaproteobacteria bacterium]|nr:serine--tRNA ligase [Deltaproteobacteria bacterium]
MLDPKFILANLEKVEEAVRSKAQEFDFPLFQKLEAQRRKIQAEHDSLRARQNEASGLIAKLQKGDSPKGDSPKGKKDTTSLKNEMKEVSSRLKDLVQSLTETEESVRALLLTIPNIPHESVPRGADASANKEIRKWGKIPEFSFNVQDHAAIGEKLKILNVAQAAKIAGSRFTLYKGMGARLERVLAQFMLDLHTQKHGYLEILPPFLANERSLIGTAMLPKFEADLFKTREGLFLIPTAEVPLTNMYQDEILVEEELPICVTAHTPCFRAEAGAAGKDTRGLIRQHQFNKVELMKYAHPDHSYAELEKLLVDAEKVLQLLELPYRVMLLSTGDMSFASAKTYDLEVWLPAQKAYREISSCSNFEDFQARRANIRFKPKEGGKPRFVHTLNGSGLAIGRTVAAILENGQQADGSVRLPLVLKPYLDGLDIIKGP